MQKRLHRDSQLMMYLSKNSFALDVKLSDESFIQIKNNNEPRKDLCGTPTWTLVHDKFWPLSITLCFLLLKKLDKMWKSSPEMPFCFNLKISPSCQTLWKGLDMSEKALITSNSLSKDIKISWIVNNRWLIQKLPGWKPDRFLERVY